jgi:hypothetical protein
MEIVNPFAPEKEKLPIQLIVKFRYEKVNIEGDWEQLLEDVVGKGLKRRSDDVISKIELLNPPAKLDLIRVTRGYDEVVYTEIWFGHWNDGVYNE